MPVRKITRIRQLAESKILTPVLKRIQVARQCIAHHQVSQPHSITALPPPSFPARHQVSQESQPQSDTAIPFPSLPEIHTPVRRLRHEVFQEFQPYDLTDVTVHLSPSSSASPAREPSSQPTSQCLIDMLPDDVLLTIFDFCVDESEPTTMLPMLSMERFQAWRTLVHVCRQWRSLVFVSPRRLNLQLVYSTKTPVRALDVWPALPLVIRCDNGFPIESVDNIVAVLERSKRVCQIDLIGVSISDLEKVSMAMQVPFPELRRLQLSSDEKTAAVIPGSFFGGSAPHLQYFAFHGIPLTGLPKLLLSATHLDYLYLFDIPPGYFSPETMVSALSTLTSLRSLRLGFQSPLCRPDEANRRPPPLTRLVLPALKSFKFKGVGEYLEDLVAHIDAPQLLIFHITFFNQIVFDTPQFIQFISRTPMLIPLEKAHIIFDAGAARVKLSSRTSGYGELKVKIPCIELDWQVSSLEQVCTLCLPPLSTLEDLYIYENFLSMGKPKWQDNIENTLWLELLQPFTTVKDLYLSEEFAPRIVPALQELVGGRTTEVLPTLQNIFSEGLHEGIQQFVATRQASLPITVVPWDGHGKSLYF